jgi:hypothetical protein
MHTLLQADLSSVLAREKAQSREAKPTTTVDPRRLRVRSSRRRRLRARRWILLRGA